MFEFEELEAALPFEAVAVYGAGSEEVNGLYEDTKVAAHGAQIFRHLALSTTLLAREPHGARLGWLIGVNRRPYYGLRTDSERVPALGWRPFKGQAPAPRVEGFASLGDACLRLAEVWSQEAEALNDQQRFKRAAEVYKRALALPVLPLRRQAELQAARAKTYRRLAESKKGVNDEEEDPLVGMAAEWAIQEADEALEKDPKCFLAAWEGAIAAKHIGWWMKGRQLAKKAMQAVPNGPQHRAERETASTLFLLMAEEEQEEKHRKVLEMQQSKASAEPEVDPKEVEWARGVALQLNEALKAEDFKRPHHQIWKLIGPGLKKKDADMLFSEIRQLVWEKWNPIAWQHGYRTSWDNMARKSFCARLVDVANADVAEVKVLIKEMEDRTCLEWPDIAEAVEKIKYDETWAYTKREDGTWGTWNGPTSL
ncbi:Hypothetical protein SCF082_LOCUS9999 [Durusdinium trenchii]|uniref:Uncharacterized protein n=1 Tax=Durusdinium trenchii TaxID=1381693 RepID=A0ABP0J339_9DINO